MTISTPDTPRLVNLTESRRPVALVVSDYAADHRTGWHLHDRAQLVYAEHGVMTVTTHDGVWVIPPERAVWVPARIAHEVATRGPVGMRSVFVEASMARRMPGECCVVTVSPLLREIILHAVHIAEDYDPDGPDGRLMGVLLDQLETLPETPLHLPTPDDARLRRITERLAADPADARPLEAWARDAGASGRTLARLFVRETGMTFGAWRQQARLLKALELLARHRPVTEVALDLGYDSPSAFIAMFKRNFGVSPGRYFQPVRPS